MDFYYDVYFTLGVLMETPTPMVIYEHDGCSVVTIPGNPIPSLALTPEVAEQLCILLTAASKAAETLPPSKKSEPIHQLCSRLQGVLANFGRGLIEWEAKRAHEPTVKAAAMEVLAAVQALERIQGNNG
ncbi:MAG: hypothetical protein D3M94_16045 [Rhodocyclales bacterium GT-UBC]|nr:MAG: hypothetical protein D3M94_16045 [Rhodocyclales bacterium GT-UBC]